MIKLMVFSWVWYSYTTRAQGLHDKVTVVPVSGPPIGDPVFWHTLPPCERRNSSINWLILTDSPSSQRTLKFYTKFYFWTNSVLKTPQKTFDLTHKRLAKTFCVKYFLCDQSITEINEKSLIYFIISYLSFI